MSSHIVMPPDVSRAPPDLGDGLRMASSNDVLIIEPARGHPPLPLRELWDSRELLYFLSWRDITVRYRQTVLGALWAVLQPLLTMVIFTVLFGWWAGFQAHTGVPYALLVFSGMLPWLYFSSAAAKAFM